MQPIQDFILRMSKRRCESTNYTWGATHELMIDLAKKHHITYGEENLRDFIHLLDGWAERVSSESSYAAELIEEQAKDMHLRTTMNFNISQFPTEVRQVLYTIAAIVDAQQSRGVKDDILEDDPNDTLIRYGIDEFIRECGTEEEKDQRQALEPRTSYEQMIDDLLREQ